MNEWVGGTDPEFVGEINASILLKHLPVDGDTRLLDFGMGIGRVAAAVLRQRPQLKSLTGIDIIPRMVEFCETHIGARFPNVNFELLADQNVHYDPYQSQARPKTRADLSTIYGGKFDCAYAISVFTHIDVGYFVDLLRFVGALLAPGGRLLFSAFALTPFSRQQIATGKSAIPVPHPAYEQDGAVLIGNTADRLAFIGYDISLLEHMVWEAGLIPSAIEYGAWRGDKLSGSWQDNIVCRKPVE
jgi:SAM-dependent methyltransferase